MYWIVVFCALFIGIQHSTAQTRVFVSPTGNDHNDGSIKNPLQTLDAALNKVNQCKETSVEICLRKGTYYLTSPIVISPELIGERKLLITSWNREPVIISGATKLNLKWKRFKGNVWEASLNQHIDQLWINGERKVLARYPNFRENTLFHGASSSSLSKERVKRWKNPQGGFIHAMHRSMWGSQHYEILGKIKDSLIYRGGYQISRPSLLHPSLRYVENIKEELDTLNEWYWDKEKRVLYYYTRPDEDLSSAEVEGSILPQLMILKGTLEKPLQSVSVRGITFTKTDRTFMQPYETLLRSDWRIYRGASLFMENTMDCSVVNCEFKDLGGNAIFVSKYAYNDTIQGNYIHDIGSSAICLVGDTSAVRSGSYAYSSFVLYEKMDLVPGAKNELYPRQCIVADNLIHNIGLVEKQVAGVEMQITALNKVSHNTIYDVPRAGINIGDGTFGGQVIEYNDVFNTVLETSDHGAFNSWGRDRFWHPDYNKMAQLTSDHPALILKDALYTTIIRNNRFRCDHGWDIDLDDGSSNYHIYDNVCLSGGIKLREGFYRKVENNIVINNSLHPHVWFKNSGDVVRRNIFMQPYYPISVQDWGTEIDYNFFVTPAALGKVRAYGNDKHSLNGKLSFVDVDKGNYTLHRGSDAFRIGFENIPMDRFGVMSASLKAMAKQPSFPALQIVDIADKTKEYEWIGSKIRSVSGLGDRSAFGLPDESGVVIVSVNKDGIAAKSSLQPKDVIREMGGVPISNVEELYIAFRKNSWKKNVAIKLYRNQREISLKLMFKHPGD